MSLRDEEGNWVGSVLKQPSSGVPAERLAIEQQTARSHGCIKHFLDGMCPVMLRCRWMAAFWASIAASITAFAQVGTAPVWFFGGHSTVPPAQPLPRHTASCVAELHAWTVRTP